MPRLPFLRPRLGPEEYARLAAEALDAVAPVAELLQRRGVVLGRVEQGRAHTVEIEAVSAQLAVLGPLAGRVATSRPARSLRDAHRELRRLLDSYGELLREYEGAGRAIDAADADAYRRHNDLGRAADDRACRALQALLGRLAGAGAPVEVPGRLRRIAARSDAYRRVAGGAFAFWE